MIDICSPAVKPYCGIFYDQTAAGYRIVAYRAYDNHGLIGSEHNGIAILDEINKKVVLDEHMRHNTGYSMDESAIKNECDKLIDIAGTDKFQLFVNSHPNTRQLI